MSNDNTHNGFVDRGKISRRRLLLAAGTTGVMGLAGCAGDSGNGDGRNDSVKQGVVDPILDEAQDVSLPPKEYVWNPFAAEGFNGNLASYLFELGAILFIGDGKLRPVGYSSWSYDKKRNIFTTKLRDDLKQWNGDPYTAEDVYVYDEMERLQAPDSSSYEKIELAGDNAIDYHLKKPTNPTIHANIELFRTFSHGKKIWQPWLEKYQDATTQAERDKIYDELTAFEISHEELRQKGLGTGAYKLTEVSDQRAILKRWDGHRNADDITVETLRINFAASQSRYGQLLTKDKTDFGRAPFPAQYKGAAPDYLKNLATWPTKNNIKMLINWRNRKELQDLNVRRAMAAVINTKPIATSAGNGKPIPVHSGMDAAFNKQYVGNPIESFINYSPSSSNYELADTFLERSGYSRQNGTVVGPNGAELDPLRFTIGTDGQWNIGGKWASEQLMKYGFPIESKTISRSAKLDLITEPEEMDNWDLSTESHYAGTTLHPLSYFDYGTFWGWRLGPGDFSAEPTTNAKIEQWLEQGKEFSPYNGKPLTPEIPTQIGQQDLSGKTKTLNLYELIREMKGPVSEERTKEIIRDLSWAWNFHLPDIDLYVLIGGMWADTKNFKWPKKRWPITGANNAGLYYIVGNGLVDYVKK
jgi:peptide/nickel transport system substrate-binding protein